MKPYTMHIHERPLTLVKFCHDGDFFMTCAKDGEVNLVRTETVERVGTYAPPGEKPGAMYACDVTMDCAYVVTAGADGKLQFYLFDGTHVKTVNHGGILKYCEWNQKPGAQNKVVTCNDKFTTKADGPTPNRIMVWSFDEETGCKRLLTIDSKLKLKATKVKWGAFDESLISIDEEGYVSVWDATNGAALHSFEAHKATCTSLNFNEDRTLMVTTSKDHTCKLWGTDTFELVKTYKSDRPLNDAAITPLFDSTDADKKRYHIIMGGGQDAKDVTTTASSSGKFEPMMWHMVFEEEIGQVKGGFGPMNCITWFRDGSGFVTGGEDGYVRVHHFDGEYFTNKRVFD